MRIRKISCYKVIVQLTNNDLDQLDVDLENEPKANIHKFLFEVMKKVQTHTGFDPYHGGQVIVEASPNESGMELVISKIPTVKKKMSREEFKRIKSIKVKETDKIEKTEYKTVFVFNTYEDLENVMARTVDDIFMTMSLYRHNGKYALICTDRLDGDIKRIICEYSSQWGRYNPRHCHIAESWEPVAKNIALCDMSRNVKEIL